jgi:hypothetical protein
MSRLGDWMVTASGGQYWPLDPRPAEVSIIDIGAALSMLCRFGGHTNRFYSVAEHSVLVSRVVPPRLARQALMHDAAEAYCVDVPRPLKQGLGAAYAEIERRNWHVIADKYLIHREIHPDVHRADNAVLMAERYALLPSDGPTWSVGVEPADVEIVCHSPTAAYQLFMHRFYELFPEA